MNNEIDFQIIWYSIIKKNTILFCTDSGCKREENGHMVEHCFLSRNDNTLVILSLSLSRIVIKIIDSNFIFKLQIYNIIH